MLHVKAKQIESALICGYRQEWASGKENNGAKRSFMLTSGAGLGSPWLLFTLDGKDYVAHVEDIVAAFIGAIDG